MHWAGTAYQVCNVSKLYCLALPPAPGEDRGCHTCWKLVLLHSTLQCCGHRGAERNPGEARQRAARLRAHSLPASQRKGAHGREGSINEQRWILTQILEGRWDILSLLQYERSTDLAVPLLQGKTRPQPALLGSLNGTRHGYKSANCHQCQGWVAEMQPREVSEQQHPQPHSCGCCGPLQLLLQRSWLMAAGCAGSGDWMGNSWTPAPACVTPTGWQRSVAVLPLKERHFCSSVLLCGLGCRTSQVLAQPTLCWLCCDSR